MYARDYLLHFVPQYDPSRAPAKSLVYVFSRMPARISPSETHSSCRALLQIVWTQSPPTTESKAHRVCAA